jgi:hypothetical protein
MRARPVLGLLSSSEASPSQGDRVAPETRNFGHVVSRRDKSANGSRGQRKSGFTIMGADSSCTCNSLLPLRNLAKNVHFIYSPQHKNTHEAAVRDVARRILPPPLVPAFPAECSAS